MNGRPAMREGLPIDECQCRAGIQLAVISIKGVGMSPELLLRQAKPGGRGKRASMPCARAQPASGGLPRQPDQTLELRTGDRYRKLERKIDVSIAWIDDGSDGCCKETGETIGLTRLEASPRSLARAEWHRRSPGRGVVALVLRNPRPETLLRPVLGGANLLQAGRIPIQSRPR